MRFLCVFSAVEGPPPDAKEIAAMGALIGEMASAGVLVATEGCLPSEKGARVRLSKGAITVTDGPFAETKEVIGGFAILETKNLQEAIQWTKRFAAVAGDGVIEVRELHPTPAFVRS
jgi:hypothetical protein